MEQYGLEDLSDLTPEQVQEFQALRTTETQLQQAAEDLAVLKAQGVDIAKLGAALGAFVAGGTAAQVDIAAYTGQNAAENNAFFLVPLAIVLLKAVDIGITIYELNELRKAIEAAGDNETERNRVIRAYLGGKVEEAVIARTAEQLVKKLLPGATLISSIMSMASDRGIVSGKNADKVRKALDNKRGEDRGSSDSGSYVGGPIRNVDIVSSDTRQHILYGDGPGSGGHLWPGQPGKTPFSKDWDGDKIIHEIGDIATSPNTKWYAQTGNGGHYTKTGKPAKWVAWESRDGTRIRVVYEPATGRVVTGFPDSDPIPNLKPID